MSHMIDHFKTITSHKILVMGFCFKCGLYTQGLLHDLSKYSPTEFGEGIKYWTGNESPNNASRRDIGYSAAWMHHKGRNRHHFDYWVDYAPGTKEILFGVDMPRRYIAELICDRIAASMTYSRSTYRNDSALNYYLKGKDGLWFVSENTKKDIEFLLRMVAKRGHEKTFEYIKNVYLRGK